MSQANGEPTEEPTPERLLKARRRGQVAFSRDLSASLGFLVTVAVIVATAPAGAARLIALFGRSMGMSAMGGAAGFAAACLAAFDVAATTVMVPLGAALVVGVLVSVLQTGGLFAWQAAKPDLTRLSPAAGLKKLLGVGTLVEMGKGLGKVIVVAAVAIASLRPAARRLPELAGAPPRSVLAALGFLAERLGLRVALALVAFGTIDWLLARRRTRRSLMMTRDEVKREYKEAEGDPHHKAERHRLHREMAEQRMVEDVRKADFVVVNPDHIAVAVRYDRDADAAPVVVAKGERLLAERIKQVARESGVPIYRDLSLARALNDLPEGDEIPEALYEAVAELLRVLWEMDGRPPTTRPATEQPSSPVSWAPASPSPQPTAPQSSTWKRV